MYKINSSEHNILSYKCNDLKFCEHEFNSAQSANFVSTNLKTPVHRFAGRLSQKGRQISRMRVRLDSKPMEFNTHACKLTTFS